MGKIMEVHTSQNLHESTGTPPFTYMGVVNSIRRPPDMVWRSLRSFLNQKIPPTRLLFIDQNTTPMELPADLKSDLRIVHLHKEVPSVGLARNLVPENPGTNWLIFCDDDGFLAPDYSEEFAKLLNSKPDLELAAGPYVHDTDGEYYSYRHNIGGRLDNWLGTKLLMGANICIRPEVYNRIGRYDTRFGPGAEFPSSDETDLCWKAYSAKVNMRYSEKLRVFHPPAHSSDTSEAVKKAFNYGRGKGALTAKWMFERPSFLGYWEFFEMTVTPFVNMVRGCLKGEFRQVRIQTAVVLGRFKGFFQFYRVYLKRNES